MADLDSAPRQRQHGDDTGARPGDVAFSVQGGAWTGLPAQVAAMVAPPIVVTAVPVHRSEPPPPAARRSPWLPDAELRPAAAPGQPGVVAARTGAAPPQPVSVSAPMSADGLAILPAAQPHRRLEVLSFGAGPQLLSPGAPRAGRHRRPARAS